MTETRNARSESISLGTASRRILGNFWELKDEDSHSPLTDSFDDHTATRSKSKRIGTTWILVALLFLLGLDSHNQVILDNFIPSAVFGLYSCGAILAFAYVVNVWFNRSQNVRKRSLLDTVQRLINVNSALAFIKACSYSIVGLFGSIVIRVSLQSLLFDVPQCLSSGVEGLVPLGYALWTSMKRREGRIALASGSSVSTGFLNVSQNSTFRHNSKTAILLGLSVYVSAYMLASPRSTVICEARTSSLLMYVQMICTILDVFILVSAESCFGALVDLNMKASSGATIFTSALCFLCAPVILFVSSLFKVLPEIQAFDRLDASYYRAFAWMMIPYICIVLLSIRLLYSKRIWSLLSAFSGVSVLIALFSALSNREGISFLDFAQALLALSALVCAIMNVSQIQRTQLGDTSPSTRTSNYSFYLVICAAAILAIIGSFSAETFTVGEHPLDSLIYAADQRHETWASQAKESQTFDEAIVNYRKRYNRLPPPEFRTWYNFAIARNSDVLDDFDNIERDLAPFRALSPAELRERVKQVVSDPYNEVGVIKIREGKAIVDEKFEGHKWMMDVMVLMIEYFIQSLPDMDIPFNINDESRVVVSYQEMQDLLAKQRPSPPSLVTKNWSSNTGKLLDEPLKDSPNNLFDDWSFKNNFEKYSTLACAPNSPARRTRSWSLNRLCIWCAKPHSLLQFIQDWDLSGDPCHQPDLAKLHGFYQGSGSYKTTKKLLPVFSPSKPQGYSDILYPSIWEWDNARSNKYAPNKDYPTPDYANKSTTLFWRGPTSEGFTRNGEWRTFSRQRFVYMNTKSTQAEPVYLPMSKGSDRYVMQQATRKQFLNHAMIRGSRLKLDTRFTKFEKGWKDLDYEPKVFDIAEETDFQANWQHKYLMSTDEASASKSFIPFVQSNCLPFRSTIFREWFDDRLVAWKHFVPVDLRFQGFWSTLAYFAGGFGTIRSNEGMDAGEFIAESGRLWGSRTLRRDDMEIYLFRLLLEWGRLLDDKRDELGFQL